MSSRKQIRFKRYKVKDSSPLTVIFQNISGEVFNGKVLNISARGFSFSLKAEEAQKLSLANDQVLTAGKFKAGQYEFSLGRCVVKFCKSLSEQCFVGVMTLDASIPVNEQLSKYLEMEIISGVLDSELELGPTDVNLGDFLGTSSESVDILSKTRNFDRFHEAWKRTPRWGYYIARKPSFGTRIRLSKARSDGRDDFIIMASNDYLGLACHPEVVEAAKHAIDIYGFGSTGSAVTVGQTELHDELEEKIARIFRCQSSLLFNSGYSANLGIISGIVGPQDLAVADILSHGSIYDGIQMSQGIKRFFKHNDMQHLRKVLDRSRSEAAGGLIIVEGVFSMDGDYAPLKEIREIAKEYSCRIMIDEAHSFGVLGPRGLGLAEQDGLLGAIDITMGTFSKICGGIGGFVAGNRELVNWMRMTARSAFFSVSLPPSTVAATNKALDIFIQQPQLLGALRHNIEHFVSGVRAMGFAVSAGHKSSIIPVVIGDEEKMARIYTMLYESGIYTIPVIYPAVSRNNCRFRFTVSATHTVAEIDYALLVLKRAIEKVGFRPGENSEQAS